MNARTCRDCGNVLEPNARGCPQCALNLEAEDMIDRIIWNDLVPGLVLIVLALAALVYWSR